MRALTTLIVAALLAAPADGANAGVDNSEEARVADVLQSALVVRDPPAPAVTKLKEMQASFPGSELKVGACDKTS